MAPASKTNNSSVGNKWLRIVGIVLAILGLLVAGYMSWAELTGSNTTCPGSTGDEPGVEGAIAVDCGFVQSSVYARILGFPVALLGFGGYLAILAVWVLENRASFLREYGTFLVFGMALFGFLFSLYLTYTELFIMYTVCTWCLISAILMTIIFIIATIQIVQFMRRPAF